MKFYLNGPLNLQINETEKWQNASTEDRKRKKVHSLPNKNQDSQNLFSSKYKVFKSRQHQTVVHIKILRLPFQEGVSKYLIT